MDIHRFSPICDTHIFPDIDSPSVLRHGYGFTFKVTVAVQLLGAAVLLPLWPVVGVELPRVTQRPLAEAPFGNSAWPH